MAHRISTVTASALAIAAAGTMPTATASGDEWGLNGTYTATSNGNWAQTNDVYQDEATVRSTWTINTPNWEPCPNGTSRTGHLSLLPSQRTGQGVSRFNNLRRYR